MRRVWESRGLPGFFVNYVNGWKVMPLTRMMLKFGRGAGSGK